ncbi:cytochrome b/b6 domain-containing protein [Rhodoferax sp.]|uniref:cytochrome b/b6 domain-containing protein n=1 Tax=Rhodoferax sp. TaxID=50421 RepID=UPI00260EC7BC|nr:cytochrome b/b6 domain-containing protein [Rhodoferax sp.]MDD2810657.1 cytochrome b/b6 domain-containing protein [Rhodoferax sp.]MDD4944017.1 cytochrome b/b6 domain-containing protein [Rhodoferax sp.]
MVTDNNKILVWDAPTRVFHWLLALSFAGAYITSESDRLMGVHLTLGYTMVGLVAFRVVWGLIGTRYARFTSFIRGPEAVAQCASDMLQLKPKHSVGHNPLGAVSIVLMLLATLVVVYTGWVYFNGAAHSVKEIHEGAAGLMLAVVGVHVAGVLLASVMQGENLVGSMISGYKQGLSKDKIGWSWWPLALVLLCCVLGFWYLQWQSPVVNTQGGSGYQSEGHGYSGQGRYGNQGWRGGDDD